MSGSRTRPASAAIARKLQLHPGDAMRVVNGPVGLRLDLPVTTAKDAAAIIVFARSRAELERRGATAVQAALAERNAWVAYPKAGLLGTDLSRDVVWKLLAARGVKPVRQIALDEVWTALRFRPI